jgi:hypothetical protein
MGVVGEALHELLDVLVDHGVHRDLMRPVRELARRRQFAEEDQVRGFEIGALLGELLDGITAIQEDAVVAIDVGDAAAARRGVHERRVVGRETLIVGVGLDLLEIGRADRAVGDRHLVLLGCRGVADGVSTR